MPQKADDILFTPVDLGAISLSNRIVMAPLTRSRADSQGLPAEFAAEYYAQRAGAGLIITEATQISFEGMGYPRTPGLHTPEQVARWKSITEAVHARGAKIVAQLWHVGRVASGLNRGTPADVVAPSAIKAPGQMYTDAKGMTEHDTPRALTVEDIARIGREYRTAARNALEAGFDGVELHSANGYLLHQFLSSNVNQRTDAYGGSIENRVRMPLEVLDGLVAEIGADRVGIRLSPGHAFNAIEETDLEDVYSHYVAELDRRGLAYIHVQRPFANQVSSDIVGLVRSRTTTPVIVCGGYDAESGAAALRSGTAQAVAFGQLFIANPDLPERFRRGAELNQPQQATFYSPGREGYTDYPVLAAV